MKYLYTAVTGGRDTLRAPGTVPAGWSCVCFTDGAETVGWETRPAAVDASDPVRNARRHKLLAHHYLPDAELSVWMDGNYAVDCDLDAVVGRYLASVDIAFHPHPQRDCVYEEAVACVQQGKDGPDAVIRQVVGYALDGLPRHAGLVSTAVVVRRHTPAVASFNERWWREVESGSRRDQLSVVWALRREGLEHALLDSHCWEGPLFRWRRHEPS